MTRLRCLVPFCKRTTGRRVDEWICGDHWRPVPSQAKRLLARCRRRRDRLSFDLTWEWIKRKAIEIAAGISR